MCLTAVQCELHGLELYWLTADTTNTMAGRVLIIVDIRDPTPAWYLSWLVELVLWSGGDWSNRVCGSA